MQSKNCHTQKEEVKKKTMLQILSFYGKEY